MRFYVNVNGTLAEIGDGKSAYELAVYYGYTGTEQEWLKSLHGKDGSTVTLDTSTKHWFLDGVDTGILAEGVTPSIDLNTKHWMLGSVDTNIVAEGIDGVTPQINSLNNWEIGGVDTGIKAKGETPNIDSSTKHWFIGGIDTGVVAEAQDGITPSIDSLSKHWMIGSTDTGIKAEGKDGATPQIDPLTKHWMIDGVDTNIIAEGVDGVDGSTPTIDTSTKHWFINGQDTGIIAEGTDGVDGKDGKSISTITKDNSNNIIVTFTDGTTQNIGQLNIDVQADFLTSGGFGNLRYYNGHFQYYDTNSSTWIDTSVTPSNVYIMNMTPQPMKSIFGVYDVDLGKYKLRFEEPDDTIIDGQVACIVEKVIIRRKLGSVPISETDGDLVLEVKRKDFGSYKNNYYIDTALTPSSNDVWYYKAFPMSTTGFYNTSSTNETDGIKCKNYNLYGFKLDQNESNPDSMITYLSDCDNKYYKSAKMNYTTDTFDYGDWGDVWFIKNLKPCMLKYDGTVDYELDKNDYTKKLDGTDSDISNDSYGGNAMVGIPKVYWKIVDNGDNTANIYFSDKQVDSDFHCWSHIDNNGNEIDYCYMPIYNGSLVNDKLRCLSGKVPLVSELADSEKSYALANNKTDDVIWYTEVFADRQLVNLLLVLIGKTVDGQAVFGKGNDFNTSVLSTGTLNNKGLFYGANNTNSGVKVFGMENYWGNLWRRINGWVNNNGTQKIKLTYGKNDGSTVNGYNNTGDGYITLEGCTFTSNVVSFLTKMKFTEYGLVPVVANGGSSTTYYTDILCVDVSQTTSTLVGGATHSDSGYFAGYLWAPGSLAYEGFNASISCKPLASTT